MIGKSQQVVLVGFAVVPRLHHLAVGHVFKVVPHFPLHQPGKGIEPASDTHQFGKDDIGRVSLQGVRPFVSQHLFQLAFRVRFGADEYPLEEGERAVSFLQAINPHTFYIVFRTTKLQANDAEQLDEEAERKRGHSRPVDCPEHLGQPLLPVCLLRGGCRCSRHDNGGIKVYCRHHRLVGLNPFLNVQ